MTLSDSFSSSVWAGVALTYCAERILTYGAAGEGNVFGYAPVLMEDEDTMGQSCPLRFYLDRAGTGTQAVRAGFFLSSMATMLHLSPHLPSWWHRCAAVMAMASASREFVFQKPDSLTTGGMMTSWMIFLLRHREFFPRSTPLPSLRDASTEEGRDETTESVEAACGSGASNKRTEGSSPSDEPSVSEEERKTLFHSLFEDSPTGTISPKESETTGGKRSLSDSVSSRNGMTCSTASTGRWHPSRESR